MPCYADWSNRSWWPSLNKRRSGEVYFPSMRRFMDLHRCWSPLWWIASTLGKQVKAKVDPMDGHYRGVWALHQLKRMATLAIMRRRSIPATGSGWWIWWIPHRTTKRLLALRDVSDVLGRWSFVHGEVTDRGALYGAWIFPIPTRKHSKWVSWWWWGERLESWMGVCWIWNASGQRNKQLIWARSLVIRWQTSKNSGAIAKYTTERPEKKLAGKKTPVPCGRACSFVTVPLIPKRTAHTREPYRRNCPTQPTTRRFTRRADVMFHPTRGVQVSAIWRWVWCWWLLWTRAFQARNCIRLGQHKLNSKAHNDPSVGGFSPKSTTRPRTSSSPRRCSHSGTIRNESIVAPLNDDQVAWSTNLYWRLDILGRAN